MVKTTRSVQQTEYDRIMHGWAFAEFNDLTKRIATAAEVLNTLEPHDIRHRSFVQIRAQHLRDQRPAEAPGKKERRRNHGAD